MRFLIYTLPLAFIIGCGGSGDAASGVTPAAPKKAGLSCDVVVKHVVDVLHGEQGDDAFLKPADVPKLTAGCKKAGNLKTDPNAQCVADAKKVEDFGACGKKAFDNLVVPWMS